MEVHSSQSLRLRFYRLSAIDSWRRWYNQYKKAVDSEWVVSKTSSVLEELSDLVFASSSTSTAILR